MPSLSQSTPTTIGDGSTVVTVESCSLPSAPSISHRHMVRILHLPVDGILSILVRSRNAKHHHRILCGLVLIVVGSTMAQNPVSWLPHVLWDALAYFVHGCGTVPLLHHLSRRLPYLFAE